MVGVPARAAVFISSDTFYNWNICQVPSKGFSLTCFRSKLVLVGGKETGTQKLTNNLWVSSEGENWELSLPPMPTEREFPITTAIAETLMVAGGYSEHMEQLDVVEVLVGGEWCRVQSLSLPTNSSAVGLCSHNNSLFLMSSGWKQYFHCPLQSLQSDVLVWREIQAPLQLTHPTSYQQHFFAL